MILPRQKGPVAEWPFEGGVVRQLTWSTLERSLASCEIFVSILSAHRLLLPNALCLSQWMRTGECKVAQSERVERADIRVSVDPSKPLDNVFSLCRSVMDSESVYPLTIELSGVGAIITACGESVVDDLVWVRATTLEKFRISIATQSDAWLPFSLKAEPQHDIYTLNADRMASALQEIERQTGFYLEEGAESYYSVIKGFHLDNVRYADGSVADVS